MKTLPHALFDATDTKALPASLHGVLVPLDGVRDTGAGGSFVVVDSEADIAALRNAIASGAAGVAFTGFRTGAEIQRLSTLLSVAEAEEGRADGSTVILAVTDGILPAPVSPQSLSGKPRRLAALVWDHRILAKTLGAIRTQSESGEWTGAFASARAATLLTAATAGIPAYDTSSKLAADAFVEDCQRSHDDGFFGRVTIDMAQAAVIETIYGRGFPDQTRG